MAIQSNITLQNGLQVSNAYLRIDIMRGNKNKVGFNLVPYANSEAPNQLEEGTYYEFVPLENENSDRWDKQAYEYLKTLPEFSDAIDV